MNTEKLRLETKIKELEIFIDNVNNLYIRWYNYTDIAKKLWLTPQGLYNIKSWKFSVSIKRLQDYNQQLYLLIK